MNAQRRTGTVAETTLRFLGPPLDDVNVPADVNVAVRGSRPHTLVLLHGLSDNLLTWRRVVPALACEHRVVAIDLPGHGATSRTWRAPLLDGYADLVAEVLDSLGVSGPVTLMGNSMGAAVSTLFAERYPERVDALALIGMPGVTRVPIAWRAAASRPASAALRTALRPVPVANLQRSFGWLYARTTSPHARAIDPYTMIGYNGSYADRGRLFGLADIARTLLSELRAAHLDRILATLDVPVLQIWGRHDRLVPPRHVTRGESSIVLSGGGHCPQLDAPDLVLEAVIPFFNAIVAAAVGAVSRAHGSEHATAAKPRAADSPAGGRRARPVRRQPLGA